MLKISTPLCTAEKLTEIVQQSLDDHKAQDVVVIDLENKTDIADYMIIASGTSSTHIASLAEKLISTLKKHNVDVAVEGLKDSRWVLVDNPLVIVHLFYPEMREYYALEKMWSFEPSSTAITVV